MAHDMVFELTDVRVISTSGAKKKKVPLTNKVGPPHQLVKEQDAWVTGSRERLVDTQLSSPQLPPLGQEELMCVHTRSLSLTCTHACARTHTHGNSNTVGRQPSPWGNLQTPSHGYEKGRQAVPGFAGDRSQRPGSGRGAAV